MGNYLVACALSGLNLHPDEEIVVVPLFRKEHPLTGPHCNSISVEIAGKEAFLPARQNGRRPTDIYQIGLPFTARYDEAGGFHLAGEGTEGANWLVSHIAQFAIHVTDSETSRNCRNEFRPSELPQDMEDALREVQVAVRNGYLILGKNSHEKHSLSFAFVQKNVFDYVKAQSPVRDSVQEQIARHLRYATAETTLFMANINSNITGNKNPKISAKRQEYSEKCEINMPFDLGFYIHAFYPPAFMRQVGRCRHTWRNPESREQYSNLLHAKLDALDLNIFMDETLHKCWQPSMYAGDQHDNVDMLRFNRFVEKTHKTRLEALYGDEFDEMCDDPFADETIAPAAGPRL
jgi:hypothetical protein